MFYKIAIFNLPVRIGMRYIVEIIIALLSVRSNCFSFSLYSIYRETWDPEEKKKNHTYIT